MIPRKLIQDRLITVQNTSPYNLEESAKKLAIIAELTKLLEYNPSVEEKLLIRLNEVKLAVEKEYNVGDLRSKTKDGQYVKARYIYVNIAKNQLNAPHKIIMQEINRTKCLFYHNFRSSNDLMRFYKTHRKHMVNILETLNITV